MTAITRRTLLRSIAGVSCASALPFVTAGCRKTSGNVFIVKFAGPLAFIDPGSGEYIYVYTPQTQYTHYPMVSCDSDESPLLDQKDTKEYKLEGLPAAKSTSRPKDEPVAFKLPDASKYAAAHCRISIAVPRPTRIKSVHAVRVKVGTADFMLRPTGLHFVYEGVSKNITPKLSSQRCSFTPSFDAGDPVREMEIRSISERVKDENHDDAKQSFKDVCAMCGIKQAPALEYAGQVHADCVGPLDRGPGADCQTLSTWITPA